MRHVRPQEVRFAVHKTAAANNGCYRRRRLGLLSLTVVVTACSTMQTTALRSKGPNICRSLLLSELTTSLSNISPILPEIESPLTERLRYEGQLSIEALKTALFPDTGCEGNLRSVYSHKYPVQTPDVILAVETSFIRFLDSSSERVFQDKPQELPTVLDSGARMFGRRSLRRWRFNRSTPPHGTFGLYRESIPWPGRKWLVIATVLITSLIALLGRDLLMERKRRKQAEIGLERAADFQRLISEVSEHLINPAADKIDFGIDTALQQAAHSLKVDRLSFLEFVHSGMDLLITHSSSTEGKAELQDLLKRQDYPYCIAKLSNNEIVVLPSRDDLAAIPSKELDLLVGRGIVTGVLVPMEAGGEVLGALSFVSTMKRRWSQEFVECFTVLAQIFTGALVRKRADEALLWGELLKGAILTSLSSNVVVADRNGQILSTNSMIEPTLISGSTGSVHDFSEGANCLEIYQRASRAGNVIASEIIGGITAVLDGKRPQVELEWESDFKEGRKWFMTSVTPLRISVGGLVITHTEITKRKQAEEERMELSGRLIDMQEKERSRLARELHDDFNQRLAVLAIDLERAAQAVSTSSVELSQRLHELWNRAGEIGADLHCLSHRLHSSTLESLGLVLGVSSLCSEFAEQNGIQVDFAHEGIARFVPPDIALCLFRVAQEGLRNVKRHSGACRAEVRLEGAERVISLSISDKGIGFDSERSRVRSGLGIRSMQERLRLLGGRFEICSQPNEGTVIHASIPLIPARSKSDDANPR
jgi:signal transduction histidine kinase